MLYRCVRFVESFPILADRPKLTWAHYRVLIPVADPAQRRTLEREAIKLGWTCTVLEDQIRPLRVVDAAPADNRNATPPPAASLLTPRCGTPGVCKVIAAGTGLVVDLGFATYRDLPADAGHPAGTLVQLDAAGRIAAATRATKADLFTYAAAVLKVVDGDTLWVQVYLEPGRWVKQKLRLRDLDCPEIATPEGKAAKRCTEALVARATAVTICTTKPDKYDRYLADVLLQTDGAETFLNNELLANGHAVLKREWEFGDWGT